MFCAVSGSRKPGYIASACSVGFLAVANLGILLWHVLCRFRRSETWVYCFGMFCAVSGGRKPGYIALACSLRFLAVGNLGILLWHVLCGFRRSQTWVYCFG